MTDGAEFSFSRAAEMEMLEAAPITRATDQPGKDRGTPARSPSKQPAAGEKAGGPRAPHAGFDTWHTREMERSRGGVEAVAQPPLPTAVEAIPNPPEPVADLNGRAANHTGGIELSWTAPAAGSICPAVAYAVRRADFPISTAAEWDAATPVQVSTPRGAPGPRDLGFRPGINGYSLPNQHIDRTGAMYQQYFGREKVKHADGTWCEGAIQYC